jgi:hypothetical protein
MKEVRSSFVTKLKPGEGLLETNPEEESSREERPDSLSKKFVQGAPDKSE